MSDTTVRAMTGSEIARILNISRQSVSQTLKRAVEKIYVNLIDSGYADTPFDAVHQMMAMFNVTEESDIREFFELFPKHIQQEVKAMEEFDKLNNATTNETRFCKDCENWLTLSPGTVECDFDNFPRTAEKDAKLFTAVEWDCCEFRKRDE